VSLKWPPKDPDARLDYSVDWSRFLGSDTISAVAWFINDADGVKTSVSATTTVNGLTFEGGSNSNTVALGIFSAGTNNLHYTVTCQITFGTDSLISERKIKLPIREQ
jgi:hypothetical protein